MAGWLFEVVGDDARIFLAWSRLEQGSRVHVAYEPLPVDMTYKAATVELIYARTAEVICSNIDQWGPLRWSRSWFAGQPSHARRCSSVRSR